MLHVSGTEGSGADTSQQARRPLLAVAQADRRFARIEALAGSIASRSYDATEASRLRSRPTRTRGTPAEPAPESVRTTLAATGLIRPTISALLASEVKGNVLRRES